MKPGCSFETVIRLEEVAGLVPVKVSRIGEFARAQFTAPVLPVRARCRLAIAGRGSPGFGSCGRGHRF